MSDGHSFVLEIPQADPSNLSDIDQIIELLGGFRAVFFALVQDTPQIFDEELDIDNFVALQKLVEAKIGDEVDPKYLEVLCDTLTKLVKIRDSASNNVDIFSSAIPAAIDDLVRTGFQMWIPADQNNMDSGVLFLKLITSLDLSESDMLQKMPMFEIHNILGRHLITLFEESQKLEDINEAIGAFQKAVALTANDDEQKLESLTQLSDSYRMRFQITGDLNDLRLYSQYQQQPEVSQTVPDDDAGEGIHYTGLATSLAVRFYETGNVDDINQAIMYHGRAIALTPDDHPAKSITYFGLASALLVRFELTREVGDIDQCILNFRRAVDLVQDGHPSKSSYMTMLGNALRLRFRRLGKSVDIDQSVSFLRRALRSALNDGSEDGMLHDNLGESLRLRFERFTTTRDLEDSITHLRKALELTPEGDRHRPSHHTNLAEALRERFQLKNNEDDINEAIIHHRKAIALIPEKDPDTAEHHTSFGRSLAARYNQRGDIKDADEAIVHHSRALDLIPDTSPFKGKYYTNVGSSILYRFDHLRKMEDLTDAISHFRLAVELTPDDDPDKQGHHSNLGDCYSHMFQYLDNIDHLNEAILNYQRSLKLLPERHADVSLRLDKLGEALRYRFERLGDLEDINQSIMNLSRAVQLMPEGHSTKPIALDHLGIALRDRYEKRNDVSDINQSILHHQRALDLTPDGRYTKPSSHTNLGNSFLWRFQTRNNPEDLDKSILHHQKSVDLTGDEGPSAPLRHANLGNSLMLRFQKSGNTEDINKAIFHHRQGMTLIPEGHINKVTFSLSLSGSLAHSYQGSHDSEIFEEMMDILTKTANMSYGAPQHRFEAAKRWAFYTQIRDGLQAESTLEAYKVVMEILPRLSWIGVNVRTRFQQLYDAGTIALEAASVALAARKSQLALEWLEQGRSVVWAQILQLRSPLDQLELVRSDLAGKLRQAWGVLEETASREPGEYTGITSERRIQLARDSERVVDEVRSIPGFTRFLLPREYNELRGAADSGPVVVLNASRYGCDALILVSGAELHHISLEGSSIEMLHLYQRLFRDAVSGSAFRSGDLERAFGPKSSQGDRKVHTIRRDEVFQEALAFLWLNVVEPCIRKLNSILPTQMDDNTLMHIHWCPSGPFVFFPIHAAGLYNTNGTALKCLSDIAISSYVPTIGSLLASQAKQSYVERAAALDTPGPFHEVEMLAIIQADTPGQMRLPGTLQELRRIRGQVKNAGVNLTVIQGKEATPEVVLNALPNSTIVHFACHGTQNVLDPLKSGLLLNGGSLELSTLTKTHLFKAQLAFLSACETATGDDEQPDEAIHIAAGMLAAGFKSVIATMWTIPDNAAPIVAEEVYRRLFNHDHGSTVDVIGERNVAEALHFSIQSLRKELAKKGSHGFLEWMPFIHLGA